MAHARWALAHVKYDGACIGAYDLIVDVRCETQTELTAFLTDTLHTIPGIAVVDTIGTTATGAQDRPVEDVVISSIEIVD